MSNKDPSLRSWLGLAEPFSFAKANWLGPLLTVVGTLLFVLAVMAAFKILTASVFGTLPKGTGASFGLTGIIVAMIGAPFVVWRTMVAQKQTDVAEQGMITERIMKAVEGLGAEKVIKDDVGERTVPNLEVRIGAIYSLERIAQDSLRDHIQIMEILCAYVRNNFPVIELTPTEIPENAARPRIDAQTVLSVLGRRSKQGLEIETQQRFRLDLSRCDLSGAKLEKLNFDAAQLNHSKFEGTRFDESSLKGSFLAGANLRYASFWDADLTGARLDNAIISPSPKFFSVNRANLTGACLFGADMTDVYMKQTFEEYPTIGNADTKFDGFNADEKSELLGEVDRLMIHGQDGWQSRKDIDLKGLNYWSPYSNQDGANGQILYDAKKALGLIGWPYIDNPQ